MAYDAATLPQATASHVRVRRRRRPEISRVNRVGLTLGYMSFGAGLGAVAALALDQLAPGLVAPIAGSTLAGAVVLAVWCASKLPGSGHPLLALAIVAGGAPAVGVFLLSSAATLELAALTLCAALLALTLIHGRRFLVAFSVAMLGLLLAAPMGAAAMIWTFGR